ncbi:hypothetical protein Droror1_Dr00016715 [Drosera rotundifolia]
MLSMGLLEIALVAVPVLILVLVSLKHWLSTGSRYGAGGSLLPPGNMGWPIVGETLEFFGSLRKGTPWSFYRERMDRHDPRVFKMGMLGSAAAVICGAAGHKFLFGNENKLVRTWWPPSVHKLFGPCLITHEHLDKVKRTRKILSSSLDPEPLIKYVKTMDSVTINHIRSLWLGKEEVVVYPTIKVYALELACRMFMSFEEQELILKLSAQFNIFNKGVINIPLNFPGTEFHRAMRAGTNIRVQLRAIVMQRKSELQQKTTSPPRDVLTHLLQTSDEDGGFLNEEEIINNIILLLFAGHDTSCSVITSVIKYLAELPHVYDRVLTEQGEIAKCKGERELLEWEDIQKMKYTWQVVSEVLRLTPPVMSGFRRSLVDFTNEGFTVPKGWMILWSPATTHKDPKLFPRPEEFDASRFEGSGPPPFSYVPFGGGPRMCLGKEYARLEILVLLHNLVRKFRWELLIPDEKIAYDPLATPEKGLPIRLIPHSSETLHDH